MTTPPVSVVIPHYGDPRHAQTLVTQLGLQVGAPEFEIIVVDDASPQPYPDDPRVRLIRRPVNGGFGAAVNSGAAEAAHPYLLVLNSDLSIGETFVADLCTAAAPFQPAVVGPMVVGPDGASQWAGRKFPRALHYFVEWLSILARFKGTRWRHSLIGHDLRAVAGATVAVDWVMGAAMLIPTAGFRAVGGFDESFHMNCEEVDLQRRLRVRGVPSIFAGAVAVTHAGGASSGDHDRRVRRLVESRLLYAAKWEEHPVAVRAALVAASLINLLTNSARSLAGRGVCPAREFRQELNVVRGVRDIPAVGGRRLRIGFLTPWDIDDPNSWSGVIAPIFRAVSEFADVVPVSTHDVRTALPDRVLARAVGMVTGKKYLWEFGLANAWKRGRVAGRRIRAANVDVVLAVAASVDIAFARTGGVPIMQVSDATYCSIENFYTMFTGLHWMSAVQAKALASLSTRKTSTFLATNQWALDSLRNDYEVSNVDCVLAPLGPAVEPTGPVTSRGAHDGPLRALVVAADWKRKGGQSAVDAVAAARGAGVDVSLTVVGDAPTGLPRWADVRGRLDHAELSDVYAWADVLLDLAPATAAGVVATDAAAHGLPVIALDVGGVSTVVRDGETGVLVASGRSMLAGVVAALRRIAVDEVRAAMADAALSHAADTLGWRSWAERVHDAAARVAGFESASPGSSQSPGAQLRVA